MTIHLQGIGEHEAVPARELKPGMIVVWNYGSKSEVVSIEFSKSGKTLTMITECNGKYYSRKRNANTLVAIEKPDPRMELFLQKEEFWHRQHYTNNSN